MAYLDIPPQIEERVVCSITAAVKYEIPANLMLGIAEKESGEAGKWVTHANGSVDVGAMQFNTRYLAELESKYGITANDAALPGCYPYDLAAWRIRGHLMKDSGDIWKKAANYHSKTPEFNAIYRADLMKKAAKWNVWLSSRFATYDTTSAGNKAAVITAGENGVTPVEKVLAVPQESLTWSTPQPKKPLSTHQYRPYNHAADKALADMFAPGLLK
jgi:hypothetical protein